MKTPNYAKKKAKTKSDLTHFLDEKFITLTKKLNDPEILSIFKRLKNR